MRFCGPEEGSYAVHVCDVGFGGRFRSLGVKKLVEEAAREIQYFVILKLNKKTERIMADEYGTH